jgi:ABC-type antimicrobial peptide transport system permease subunit
MSFFRLILQNIRFYKKAHLALLAGTIISTMVLTGALITGDTVSYSLQNEAGNRLGKITHILDAGDRFVSNETALQMNEFGQLALILRTNSSASNPDKNTRINQATLLGVNPDFWALSPSAKITPSLRDKECYISEKTANQLQLLAGEEFVLRFENKSPIPSNAPFVSEEEQVKSIRIKVKAILSNEEFGRFNLQNSQIAPYNIFVSNEMLSELTSLQGYSNLIILSSQQSSNEINEAWNTAFDLKDSGLEIIPLNNNGYEIRSSRIFLDPENAKAINAVEGEKKGILTYLVNELSFEDKSTPYSFVSAIDDKNLFNTEDDIIINSWLAEDLNAKVGDVISLNYYSMGAYRELEEHSTWFIVSKIIPTESALIDTLLMPDFPGLANAGSCSEWETGVPVDLESIRPKDEDYWDSYRGTPKAIISLEAGQKMWNNRFGSYTAFRFETSSNKEKLEEEIEKNINPENLNLQFRNIQAEASGAVNNALDFGSLFLSLSFFVIFAGILLIVLLQKLSMESRRSELGVLSSLGFSKNKIQSLRITEASIIIIIGAVFGSLLGILYNYITIHALNSVWNDAINSEYLKINIQEQTIILGSLIGTVISISVVSWIINRHLKQNLLGNLTGNNSMLSSTKKRLLIGTIGFILTLSSLSATVYFSLSGSINQTSMFLSCGGGLLLGLICIYSYLISSTKTNGNISSTNTLALKNLKRNKSRSVSVVSMLAIGVFTIVVTGANKKTFTNAENQLSGGTGGFEFWAEMSIPYLEKLSDSSVLEKIGLEDYYLKSDFFQLKRISGDDASCLNLHQIQQAQLLGIDVDDFIIRNAFSIARSNNEEINKSFWEILNLELSTNMYPAIADQTVIDWGLQKKIGDTLFYKDEHGNSIGFILMAGLKSSIFQGNLLVNQSVLEKHFPSKSGSGILLVDSKAENPEQLSKNLNRGLRSQGIEISKTSVRLAEFNRVTNTYLSVFLILGGLGVLIALVGFGIIIYRNLLERDEEIKYLSAIGFERKRIKKLLYREHTILLLTGTLIGILSAITGILPSLFSTSYDLEYTTIAVLLISVLISGLIWIIIPIRQHLSPSRFSNK